jgi:hypothetical protein
MTIKTAIKKAIESGWKARKNQTNMFKGKEYLFLDPRFWQCLGKAMGWKEHFEAFDRCGIAYDFETMEELKDEEREQNECLNWERIPYWKTYWHSFIDHLADGKTAENYFKQL